jgi:hypothetical protein
MMLEVQRKRDEAKGLKRRQEEAAVNDAISCLDHEVKEVPKNAKGRDGPTSRIIQSTGRN